MAEWYGVVRMTERLETNVRASAPTDEQMYEWQARRLLRDLSDYEYYRAEVARCMDRINASYIRECGCNAIRYDKIVAGRNIGGERPEVDHERAISDRDELRGTMADAQRRMNEVERLLEYMDETTRAMAMDKYVRAEFDTIMEERYNMTRQGIAKRILNVAVKYCKSAKK